MKVWWRGRAFPLRMYDGHFRRNALTISPQYRWKPLVFGYVRMELSRIGQDISIDWDAVVAEYYAMEDIRCEEREYNETPANTMGTPRTPETPPSVCSESCCNDINWEVLQQMQMELQGNH